MYKRQIDVFPPYQQPQVRAQLSFTIEAIACQQLVPDSDLLRRLNAGDETPPGPAWVALWTEDDATVVPPDSGSLDGALDLSLQSLCPGVHAEHSDVPRSPAVIAIVESVLGRSAPATPDRQVC